MTTTHTLIFTTDYARHILATWRRSLGQQHCVTWKLPRNGDSQAPPRHQIESLHFNKMPRWLLCSLGLTSTSFQASCP